MASKRTSPAQKYCRLGLQVAITAGLLMPLVSYSAEVTDDARALGKERRDAAVARAKQQVTTLEKQRAAAAKNRNMGEVASLLNQIKQAKQELNDATKKTVEDYAKEMVDAGDDPNSRPAEPAKQPPPDPVAEQAAAADENERKKLSGNCPLKLTTVNYFHADAEAIRLGSAANLFPAGLSGPKTVVVCEVINKSGQTVEAWEFLCEFLDGFDQIIESKTFQGTLLADGESRKTVSSVAPIETAVQMKLFIQRAKLADGTIWERTPEHKRIGKLVKKLEGAKLVPSRK
jgi:hypothetical protein